MEAFIITDKVIAKQHMQNPSSNPKYIKKYDVGPNNLQIRKISHVTHKPFIKSISLNAPRTKDILVQIAEPLTKKGSQVQIPHLDRYFTLTSEISKQGPKNMKKTLLVKKFQPHSQQYDADFRPVCKRAPCWTLMGKKNRPIPSYSQSSQHELLKENMFCYYGPTSRQIQLGQLLERQQQRLECQRKGTLGQLFEPKLHYSPTDLGRCTTNIFKKYHLDKDPYFKKFLGEIQNEAA